MNQTREQGRAVKAGAEDVMDLFVRMEDVALHLRKRLDGGRKVQERKARWIGIADLDGKFRQIQ